MGTADSDEEKEDDGCEEDGGKNPDGTPRNSGGGYYTFYPIEPVSGAKIEQRTDLRIPLSNNEFVVTRSYVSHSDSDFDGDSEGLWWLGDGWRLSIFQMLTLETVSSTTTITRHWATANGRFLFSGSGSGPYTAVGGGSRQSIVSTTTTIDSVTYDVWRLSEPGRWYADYYRAGGSNSANSPAVLEGRILQQVDTFGNATVYKYGLYPVSSPTFALLEMVYLNGTPAGGAEAQIRLLWNTTVETSPDKIIAGDLDAIWVGRPNPANPPGMVDPDNLDHWIETHFVDYYYFDEFADQHNACGRSGDLVQVTKGTLVDYPFDHRSMGDRPFDIDIEQYRYHGGSWTPTSANERVLVDGNAHQLKSIIRPQQIQFAAQQINEQNSFWPASLAVFKAAEFLQTLADDDIAFYDSAAATNRQIVDMASKIVAYETSAMSGDRGKVTTQYVQSGCGCGTGGNPQGLKLSFAYDDSTPAAPFTTITENQLTGGGYTNLHRTMRYDMALIGTEEIVQITDVSITAPSPDSRTWTTSYQFDGQGRMEKKTLASGLTYGYVYDGNHHLTEVRISPSPSGSVSGYTLLQRVTYRSSGRTDLIEKLERFRVAGSSAADDIEETTYDYGLRSGSNVVAWHKTTAEAELEEENGPDGTYSSYELYDERGQHRWSRAADGALTYREYSPTTGSLLKIVRNADPASPDGDSGEALDGAADYAGLSTTGWAQPDASGELTTKFKVDLLGRTVERESPGGVKHYTIREVREDPLDRPAALYYVVVNLPHQLLDDSFDGPAQLTWLDAGGAAIRHSEYEIDALAGYDPSTFTYTLDTELARSTVRHRFSGLVDRRRGYHDIANNGYYDTTFAHDVLGRVTRVTNPNGSITAYENYDVLGRVREVKGGTTEMNLVTVSQSWFDSGGTTTEGVGDGNLTLSRSHEDGTNTRDTKYDFDFRNRLIRTRPPSPPYELYGYDNLNRVTSRGVYSSLQTHAVPLPTTDRGLYSETGYSQRGLRFVQRVATDPTAGSPVFLESHSWFDSVGRTVADWAPNSGGTKRTFDAHSRVTNTYSTDRGDDAMPGDPSNHADATDLIDDIVLEQTKFEYNSDDRLSLVTSYQRLHDAAAPGSGLSGVLSGTNAVISYVGYVYDDAQRQIRTVNIGTNDTTSGYPTGRFSNGSAPAWPPSSVPDWSGTDPYADSIITGATYNTRGLVEKTIDWHPDGVSEERYTKMLYDDLGRRIAVIENFVDASVAWQGTRWEVSGGLSSTPDEDRVTSFVYDGVGNVKLQVAHLPDGSGGEDVQMTEYLYAVNTGLQGSQVNSNDLLSEVRYPDRSTGAPGTASTDKVLYRYNRLGELQFVTDQNGTVHEYDRDSLGRVTLDDVTTLGSGIDGDIRGIEVEYDDFGRLSLVSSYDDIDGSGGIGGVVNQVEFGYSQLWQVESVAQDVDSALSVTGGNSISQRSIAYTYATQAIGTGGGSGNYSRLSDMLYPGGIGYTHHYGSVQLWNDAFSRLDHLQADGYDVNYHHVGQSMFAGVEYVAADVQLDRTLSADGKRRLAGHTSQASGVYPGWDRFGRVIAQSWVDGSLGHVSGSLPDRPQLVYETHTYDRASNRLSKYNGRDGLPWASQDNDYSYDSLDRLIQARRGRWTGSSLTPATGGLGARDSSQEWTLDMLGNWSSFMRDIDGDGIFGSPVIPPAINGDWEDIRTHNFANEIEDSTLRATVPFAYDDAGNMKEARQENSTGSRHYVHDAWNRLVKVTTDSGTSGDADDDLAIARYSYNGLHWRVLKHADTRAVQVPEDPEVPGENDLTNRREAMFYDASWRLVHREIEDGYVAGTSEASPWVPDVAEQVFWGARYIDDAVARRRTTAITDTEPFNATWEELPQWYLTDAQFSVVALMDGTGVNVLERVRYDPYGNAEHLDMADFNGNGDVTVQDWFDFLNEYFNQTKVGDYNRSSTYSVDDTSAFLGVYVTASSRAATPHGSGWVSSPDAASGGSDNVIGYCGYVFNHETSDYTVRFRHYSPGLGRWLERDPAGYRDSTSLYESVRSHPVTAIDPFGLASTDDATRGNIWYCYDTHGSAQYVYDPTTDRVYEETKVIRSHWLPGSKWEVVGTRRKWRADLDRSSIESPDKNECSCIEAANEKSQADDKMLREAGNELASEARDQMIAAGQTIGIGGIKNVRCVRVKKPSNLPSAGSVSINIDHIREGHMVGGSKLQEGNTKTIFPDTWTKEQVCSAIKDAYAHCELRRSQDEGRVRVVGKTKDGYEIEMWVNKDTCEIETAYPKPKEQ